MEFQLLHLCIWKPVRKALMTNVKAHPRGCKSWADEAAVGTDRAGVEWGSRTPLFLNAVGDR